MFWADEFQVMIDDDMDTHPFLHLFCQINTGLPQRFHTPTTNALQSPPDWINYKTPTQSDLAKPNRGNTNCISMDEICP